MGYEVRYILVCNGSSYSQIITMFEMGKVPYRLGQPKGAKVFEFPWYFPGSNSPVTEDHYDEPILGFTVDAMKEWISGIKPDDLGYFAAMNRESILAVIDWLEKTEVDKNNFTFLKYGY